MKRWSTKVLLLVATVSAAADSPYLPVSGPAPLRFHRPPEHKPAGPRLAPLPTIDPRPAEPSPVPSAPVAGATAVSSNSPSETLSRPSIGEPVPAVASEPVSPPPPFNPVVTNGIEFVRPDTENLTPQMFMKFFSGRPGTNSSGLTIIAPMPFVPPAPPAPSSTATFQTTPPTKP